MKKHLAILLALTTACTALAACSSDNSSPSSAAPAAPASSAGAGTSEPAKEPEAAPVTLSFSWWGNQTRTERTEGACKLYTEMNPHVTFELNPISGKEYWDKLTALAAGGNAPELMQQDYDRFRIFQEKGILEEMNAYVDSGAIDLSGIPEVFLGSGQVDGKYYAFNLGVNSPCLVYNKTMMDAAGITVPEQPTWDDFHALAKEVYEKTGVKTSYGTYYGPQHQIRMSVRNAGKHVYNADGTGLGFDDAGLVERVFANYEYSYTSGYGVPGEMYTGATSVELGPIVTGDSWCEFLSSNQVVALQAAMEDELAMVMNPEFADKTMDAAFLKPSVLISLSSQGTQEEKDAAAAVVNYLLNSVEANDILLAERGVPINTEVREAIADKVDEATKKTFDFISLVEGHCSEIDAPDPSCASELDAAAKVLMDEVLYGKKTAKQAGEEWMAKANSLLKA
ncbi:MAG: carbohydrate ABC transporter substrate-binding protein [Provencibacterium sp.]|jgi:multiple sugar transport system substrate-binding protein|nr:carbohydrate ABC transporter substrate-binding protein [Provencibacterium sp.]